MHNTESNVKQEYEEYYLAHDDPDVFDFMFVARWVYFRIWHYFRFWDVRFVDWDWWFNNRRSWRFHDR
jgi:hypothetical protein